MSLNTNLKYKGLSYSEAREVIQEWLHEEVSVDDFLERFENEDSRETFIREENLQFSNDFEIDSALYSKWEHMQESNSQAISEFIWSNDMEILDIVKEEVEHANVRLDFVEIQINEDKFDGTFEVNLKEKDLLEFEFQTQFGELQDPELTSNFLYELDARLGELWIENIEIKTGSYNYENPSSERSSEEVRLEIQEVNQLKWSVLEGEIELDHNEVYIMENPKFQKTSENKPFTKEALKDAKEVIKANAKSQIKENHLKIEKTTKTISDEKQKNEDLEL